MCTAPTQWPSELIPGQQAVVRRVSDETPAELRYLGTPELLPGVQITLRELAPLGEPLRIHVGDPGGGQEHTVGPQLADAIGVVMVEGHRSRIGAALAACLCRSAGTRGTC
jgi:Fe2+ transport system protein FeoA